MPVCFALGTPPSGHAIRHCWIERVVGKKHGHKHTTVALPPLCIEHILAVLELSLAEACNVLWVVQDGNVVHADLVQPRPVVRLDQEPHTSHLDRHHETGKVSLPLIAHLLTLQILWVTRVRRKVVGLPFPVSVPAFKLVFVSGDVHETVTQPYLNIWVYELDVVLFLATV